MMQWRKDANMKYTDMCIFIDQHVSQLNDPNCPPELANTIYNYLWLLVKALAIKKRMFNSFQDYDGYSFYAANRLYFALKRNLENQGKVIKGKEIKPIKSCLNYTKALLYPMKIEYLKEEYDAGKTEEEIAKRFDTFRFKQQLKESMWGEQGGKDQFTLWVQDTFQNFSKSVDNVLKRAPFAPDTLDYKKLKISIAIGKIVWYNFEDLGKYNCNGVMEKICFMHILCMKISFFLKIYTKIEYLYK